MTQLNPRQEKVLLLIGKGMNNVEISREFHVAESTISAWVQRIKQKTGLTTREQLKQLAQSNQDSWMDVSQNSSFLTWQEED